MNSRSAKKMASLKNQSQDGTKYLDNNVIEVEKITSHVRKQH